MKEKKDNNLDIIKQEIKQKRTKKSEDKIIKIPTGSYNLNMALSGCWDWAMESKRVIELYGHNGSGKSTLSWEIAEQARLAYKKAGIQTKVNIVDAEFKLDENYLQKIIEKKNYNLIKENICEEIWWKIEDWIKAGEKIIIVDSVGAMTDYEQRKRGMEKLGFTSPAKAMSWGLRNYIGDIYRNNAFIIFVNHVTFKIGVVWGDNETTPGGEKLKFFSSYRFKIWTTRGSAEKSKTKDLVDINENLQEIEIETGIAVKVKVVKNDTFSPYRVCQIPLIYGEGINKLEDTFLFLQQIGFIGIKKKKTKKLDDDDKEKSLKGLEIKGFKDNATKKKILEELCKEGSKLRIRAFEYMKKFGFEVME